MRILRGIREFFEKVGAAIVIITTIFPGLLGVSAGDSFANDLAIPNARGYDTVHIVRK